MRLAAGGLPLDDPQVFQSPPGLEAGCDGCRGALGQHLAGFNPHPALKPGATPGAAYVYGIPYEFQSPPGLESGCDQLQSPHFLGGYCFNPHPALKPGATAFTQPQSANGRSFNPHPALKPGATMMQAVSGATTEVSIPTRP